MNKYIKSGLKIAGCVSAIAAVSGGIAFTAERIEELKNYGKELKHKPYGIYERFIKRPLDCFLSTGALIVLSPVLLVTAVLVRTKLGSPVLFKQERPGRNEKIFRLYKFRTMTDERNEAGELLPDEVRLTKFGKALRATSLDELPELLNIIKGDMSVVGPRPWAVSYLEYFTPEEHQRHSVRPGLTGLAQVNGRTAANWTDRLNYDIDYVKKVDFSGDCRIVLLTAKKVLSKSDIVEAGCQGNFDDYRIKQWEEGSIPFPSNYEQIKR